MTKIARFVWTEYADDAALLDAIEAFCATVVVVAVITHQHRESQTLVFYTVGV